MWLGNALYALRSCGKGQVMCEYCEGKHHVHLYDDGFETVEVLIVCRRLYVDVSCDDYTYNVNTSAPINFCPMCGRELGGGAR